MRYSQEYVETLMAITARIARYTTGMAGWDTDRCVRFARFSVTQDGDAETSNVDMMAHFRAFKALNGI